MPSVRWVAALACAVAAVGLTAAVVGSAATPDPGTAPKRDSVCTFYVSTRGSDDAAGSSDRPWRTLSASMPQLDAGDTLCVLPGIYQEEVATPSLARGEPGAPITLLGLGTDDERPLIDGGFALVDPDHWTISNLRFTNPTPANEDNRLVSILGGEGWVFENNEVFDGPYAGVLIGASETAGPPMDYVITGNAVHDTRATGLYLNPSRFSEGGLVERNLFFDSGTENVKLGWGGDQACSGRNFRMFGIGEVTFRYNTLHGAQRGALIIAEPGGLASVDVYGNLFTQQPDHLVRYDSVGGCLGERVSVHENAGGLAPKFSEDFGDSPVNLAHEHGNVFSIDPEYESVGPYGFLPENDDAQPYGRYRDGD